MIQHTMNTSERQQNHLLDTLAVTLQRYQQAELKLLEMKYTLIQKKLNCLSSRILFGYDLCKQLFPIYQKSLGTDRPI